MNEFNWTADGYVKVLRDNMKQLNELVDSYSPTLPPAAKRVLLRDVERFADEVRILSLKAWQKAGGEYAP